jgi:hypothetical protein
LESRFISVAGCEVFFIGDFLSLLAKICSFLCWQ